MLKKLKQKICVYISTCYVCTKSFHEKPTCHLSCVKKREFGAKNKAFYKTCFIFFASITKILVFHKIVLKISGWVNKFNLRCLIHYIFLGQKIIMQVFINILKNIYFVLKNLFSAWFTCWLELYGVSYPTRPEFFPKQGITNHKSIQFEEVCYFFHKDT
jgi:hypothetical protein